ncbi:uncharacterized protein LOC142342212 isoform X3 [Convolutriloba macropyga]|uniref:uncharacterized protein LOC142342212 isoform X3 n=1 Tax=Convolutriloba macropyga TaxID=536237 RepID=UPI003F51DF6A
MKESWVFSLVAVILAITALICSLCANSNHAATYEDNDIGKVTIGLWKMCNGELGCYDIPLMQLAACALLTSALHSKVKNQDGSYEWGIYLSWSGVYVTLGAVLVTFIILLRE